MTHKLEQFQGISAKSSLSGRIKYSTGFRTASKNPVVASQKSRNCVPVVKFLEVPAVNMISSFDRLTLLNPLHTRHF